MGPDLDNSSNISSYSSFFLYSLCKSLLQKELREQRQTLWDAGESSFFVKTPSGRQWMVMLKRYGTIFVYNSELKTFWNVTDQVLLSDVLPSLHTTTTGRSPWPLSRNRGTLTDDEVRFPSRLQDFPIDPDYEITEGLNGFTETWLSFVRRRAPRGDTSAATLAPPGAAKGSGTSLPQTSAASLHPRRPRIRSRRLVLHSHRHLSRKWYQLPPSNMLPMWSP